MARRCSTKTGCSYPRANWWKQSMGVDWFNQSSSGGDTPDPVNQELFDAFETRVLADSGTVEGEECTVDTITYLRGLGFWDSASLRLLAGGVKANKIYSIVPTDGSGDFAFTRAGAKNRKGVSLIEPLATGVPSIDHTLKCPVLELEPIKTNLILRSEELDNASWTKEFTTISANSGVAPDGNSTADKIIETTDNNVHRVTQTVTKAGSALPYTFYVYAKAGERNWICIQCEDGSNRAGRNFDLTNGTIGLSRSAGTGFFLTNSRITPVVNWATGVFDGWYRCEITVTSTVATSIISEAFICSGDNVVTYAGDITKGASISKVQLEQSYYGSSYIATTTASVAKVADSVTALTGASALIGQTEGTIVLWASTFADLTGKNISLSDGTADNRIRISFTSTNLILFEITTGGVVQASIVTSFAFVSHKFYRIAAVYGPNRAVLEIDGVKIGEDLSVTVPACSKIEFGDGTGNLRYYGKIVLFELSKTTSTDEELSSKSAVQTGELVSATVTQTTTNVIDLVFSEAVDITAVGWSITSASGDVSILALIAGGGTTTPKFLVSRAPVVGEIWSLSYNPGIGTTTLVTGGAEISAILDAPISNNVHIIESVDFTGVTNDASKSTISNPGSANLTISQNNASIFTRTTDVAIATDNTEQKFSVTRFTRGVYATNMSRPVGFTASVFAFRYQFNGSNWISIQNIGGNLRVVVKVATVNVYDSGDTGISSVDARVKIVYTTANNIQCYYWNGTAWATLGALHNANVGADGVLMYASTSDAADAVNDRCEFDERRATDIDYPTELPEEYFL